MNLNYTFAEKLHKLEGAEPVHMRYLDLTLPTPADNLACDEVLLETAESDAGGEVLRVWESPIYFIVVGYANRVAAEVNIGACCARGLPVLRRCTGGGAVLIGPGCLNYALILQITEGSSLSGVADTNQFVMERNRAAIQTLLNKIGRGDAKSTVTVCGNTDLALGNLKFSGNAQRRHRRFLLFHGTFLLNFNVALVDELLRMPTRQPVYRQNRPHKDFLANLNLPAAMIKRALREVWDASAELRDPPLARVKTLAVEKYSTDAWNFKF